MDYFAPFPSLQDFTFAETMLRVGASNADIDFILKNMANGFWCQKGSSNLHFKNAVQLRRCVDEAADIYQGVSSFLSREGYFTNHSRLVCRKEIQLTLHSKKWQGDHDEIFGVDEGWDAGSEGDGSRSLPQRLLDLACL
jgi:hypothetical protein